MHHVHDNCAIQQDRNHIVKSTTRVYAMKHISIIGATASEHNKMRNKKQRRDAYIEINVEIE